MIRRLVGDEVGPIRMDPIKVQAIASALGQLFVGVSDLLEIVHSALGLPPESHRGGDEDLDIAEMGAEPASLHMQLRGDLEILVNEALPAAINVLGGIASETEESLRDKWRRRSGIGKGEGE